MYKQLIFSVLAVFAASMICAAEQSMKPQVADTIFKTDDIPIASIIINPSADSDADMSDTIQSAIDKLSEAGGGVIFLKAGKYRLDKSIIIRKGVTLRGDWTPPNKKGWERGTILIPVSGRNDENAIPAIRLASNTGITNAVIWYPDQNPVEPVPYPWSISSASHSDDPGANRGACQTVYNVTLVNSYKGIIIGPQFNFLHVLRNIYGTPLKTGISIDSCYDIGRTQNVDFKADWWSKANLPGAPSSAENRKALENQLINNATALDLGRDEWGYLYDVRASGYAVGICLRAGDGSMNGVMFGCSMVDCSTALRTEVVAVYGLGVTGCKFIGRNYAVYAPKTFAGTIQFNSCILESKGADAARSEGSGTFSFRNCDFKNWKDSAIHMEAGTLSAMSCDFIKKGSHIYLGKNSNRAIILSNTFKGKPSIVNKSSNIDLQISHTKIPSKKPDISLMPPAPNYLPATRKLFDAADFGASSEIADNTSAISNALNAAKKAGGGTVYIPAGTYRCSGNLVVPTGVELRGSFDISHHTICAGTALLPTSGMGNPNGTPFISLETGSGIRGLTIWYPGQDPFNIKEFPWAVRSLGPRCWVINLNCGNAYQGVDFWTHPSDGHVIKYLSGAYYKKGLFISKCKGEGWVDDLHFNPHFALWIDSALGSVPPADWTPHMNEIRQNLDAIVFGRCDKEYVKGTFMYAAHDGIAFRDDNGGSNARVIHHGTDTGARCAIVESSGKDGIEFINTQLTPFAPDVVGALVTGDDFNGKADFFNTMLWAEAPAGLISGKGDVLIQQLCNLSGTLTLNGGNCIVENSVNISDFYPFINITDKCESVNLIGNIAMSGRFTFNNAIGSRCSAKANSLSLPPVSGGAGISVYETGWEIGDTTGAITEKQSIPKEDMSGGVSDLACSITESDAKNGMRSIKISGNATDPKHSYAYFDATNEHIAVHSDTVVSYWIKPMNELSRNSGIDMIFNDGSDLRSSAMRGLSGEGVHPANPKGMVGEWTQISIPIGKKFFGKTIISVMFAYDTMGATGLFETYFDDLSISAEVQNTVWKIDASPVSGRYKTPVEVTLKSEGAHRIRYTTDGSIPTGKSSIYRHPILLDKSGLWDLRYSTESADGKLSNHTFGQLYDIEINDD